MGSARFRLFGNVRLLPREPITIRRFAKYANLRYLATPELTIRRPQSRRSALGYNRPQQSYFKPKQYSVELWSTTYTRPSAMAKPLKCVQVAMASPL